MTASSLEAWWYQFVRGIAWIWIVSGIIAILMATAGKDAFGFSGDFVAFAIVGGASQIVIAAGILARMRWARYLGFVGSVIALINFPVWTVLGLLMLVGLAKSGGMFGTNRVTGEHTEPNP